MEYFHSPHLFELENGSSLPEITIAYNTYGELNEEKSNVVWICHHLTANSAVADWWPGMVGEGHIIDPGKYFIICANMLGSCYGTTGPLTVNRQTDQPYFSTFPAITIRDMVKAHILLRKYLGIEKIYLLIGGSMGGYQAMEWCLVKEEQIENLFLLTTSASETAWGIAVHTAQRLAIEADSSWQDFNERAGTKGLKAARAIGMLTYRNYGLLVQNQTDPDPEKLDNYKAASYIIYQGDKLAKRFNAFSYWLLTKTMDSHNISRGRGGDIAKVLQEMKQRCLIIGVNSDILCPLKEQQFITTHMPAATFIAIDSAYGHDGFMVESEKISHYLQHWLE